eukprot:TRINITY_DN23287_c0_g1_i1.p1 TRINITY_DN23287_c0_g1~~TRINITY_DN23287_c0_g1_i1.p1  ORF type:complete len:885 (+),score=256.66 TRINITY_DN23287_c0_g1_i1:51-2657(+)
MEAAADTVANLVMELSSRKGVKGAFEVIMTGMLSVCDRQELHSVVSHWADDNAVLALPPLGCDGVGSEGSSKHDYMDTRSGASSDENNHVSGHGVESGFTTAPPTPVTAPANPQETQGKPTKPAPKNARKHPTPRCPPWLAHAGLPSDGSIPSSAEITAFSSFVGATNSEHSARASMRMSLQKLVQLLVSQEAILKVIGGWATGLATFSSTLDLVVEAPSQVNILDKIASALHDLGVKSEFKLVAGFSALRLSSDALAHAVWGQQQVLSQTSRQVQQGFDVNIFSECAGSTGPFNSRSATMKISARLNKYPEHKKTAIVIRSIIDKTNIGGQQGGANGYIILLMILAFLEEHRTHDSINDPGWVLRQFFVFYSNFNFKATTIVPVPAPGAPVFIPKVDPQSQLSIIDPLSSSGGYAAYNVAAAVTKLNQLTGTFQYINMLITRYDKDPRGTPLLPNLVACGEALWKRHAWLRKGIEVTKSLAVQVAKCVADFLENPANNSAKEELIKIAAWEPMNNSLATKLQLITRVTEQPNSPLSHFRGHVPQLVEALSQYQDNPEVQEHYQRSLRSSVTKDFAASIAKEVADYITHPDNVNFKNEMQARSFQEKNEEERQASALMILEKVAEQPGSLLAEFRPCMKSFVNVVRKKHFHGEPEIDRHHYRILSEMVTPEVASRVAAEAADFLEEMAQSPQKDEFMKELIGSGDWGPKQDFTASIAIFNMMRQRGSSVLANIEPHLIPVLAKVLAEFSDHPEVRENRRRAAAAAFTKDLAVAIQKDALAFISKPDNEKMRAMLQSCLKNGDPRGVRKELLAALCNEPGSRLSDFRGEKGVEELNGLLAPYDEDPDLLAANQQIAESVFADLRLSEDS